MKKLQLNNGLYFAILLSILAFGCKQDTKLPETEKTKITHSSSRKTGGTCSCTNNNYPTNDVCDLECVNTFMSHNETRMGSISWTGCTDDYFIPISGCNGSISPALVSTVKFCYGTNLFDKKVKCILLMEIDKTPKGSSGSSTPPCLPCLSGAPDYMCFRMEAICVDDGHTTTISMSSNDPDLTSQLTYSIVTGDPVITLCCKELDSYGALIATRCCTGTIIW